MHNYRFCLSLNYNLVGHKQDFGAHSTTLNLPNTAGAEASAFLHLNVTCEN